MTERLKLGISTCPNDTYAFHALLVGALGDPALELQIELADVQALNEGLAAGRFDVVKCSFAAALAHAEHWSVLEVGAALGFGVGPVVIAGRVAARRDPPRVLCPGRDTTATLLWRLFHGEPAQLEQVLFSAILPALARGEADLGVCIHEGRFTYAQQGLALVEDLGERWERETGGPLPLGGLLARRSLDPDLRRRFTQLLAASLAFSDRQPQQALLSMRRHASEQDDAALWKHVELYVNAETRGLSPEGLRALGTLAERARAAGLLAAGSGQLT